MTVDQIRAFNIREDFEPEAAFESEVPKRDLEPWEMYNSQLHALDCRLGIIEVP